jgi:CRISPR-associated protein Cas8a1/Csx13
MMKPKMTIRLDDRRLTMLHSAGIAGLAMTLAQLDKIYPQLHQRSARLRWSIDEVKIELFWTGDDAIALKWLIGESFKVDGDGLILLTGLVPANMDISARLAVHQGVTKSFLQHGLSRESSGKAISIISIDGKDIEIGYKKLASYAHQKFTKDLLDRKGRLQTQAIGIKSWLYPGATVRHKVDEQATIFREPPELALALLFAPLACQFFLLPIKGYFDNPRIVVVVPAVTNLIVSARSFLAIAAVNYQDRCILHPIEAGWRFFERDRQLNKSNGDRITSCQIVTFQSEVWAKQQRLRSSVEVLEVRDDIFDRYQRLTAKLSTNRVATGKKDKHFLVATKIPELIVENIIRGSPFFRGLSEIVTDVNYWTELSINKPHLKDIMNDNESIDSKTHKIFIIACHKALRTEFAKLYDKAESNDYIQFDRLKKRIRQEMIVCADARSFRRWLVRFWSGCSDNITDFKDIDDLLPSILVEGDWELFRDLALLSLVTYEHAPKRKNNSPGEVLDQQITKS